MPATRCRVAPNVLDPSTVARLLDQLSVQEMEELESYASAAGDGEAGEVFVYRASSWFIRRFNLHTEVADVHIA